MSLVVNWDGRESLSAESEPQHRDSPSLDCQADAAALSADSVGLG